MARYRVNGDYTVSKLCEITGEFHHYKTFRELTETELKKVKKYWVYNL